MNGRLKRNLKKFFEHRVDDIVFDISQSNKDFKQLEKNVQTYQQHIVGQIGSKTRVDFLEYESNINQLEGMIRTRIYREAFFDGIKAANFLKKQNF